MLPLTATEHIVDLNYLYHRREVSLFMSRNAACGQARAVHLGMADGYAELIDAEKRQVRAAASA